MYFLAAAGNLFLANLVAYRARRAPGALPIALLCVALFVWDVGECLRWSTGRVEWHHVRLVGSSLAPAFLWHFVLVFVQRDRARRRWLSLLYAVTAAFTLTTAGAFVHGGLRRFVDGRAWTLVYLALLFPFLVSALVLVGRRLREVDSPLEKNAVRFIAAGIAAGTVTGLTELVHILWPVVPRLGHVGAVLCAAILALALLRHRLLEPFAPLRPLQAAYLLAVSLGFTTALWLGPWPYGGKSALLAAGTGLMTAIVLYRLLYMKLHEQAERAKRLALIGTMAAGVAHEIKNPLAAIKGSAQFVQKELEGVEGKAEARDYLKLLVGEVDRLNGVVESFLAYARPVEPRRQEVALDRLLGDLVRFQQPSLPPGVKVETDFDPLLPPVPADPALLTQAVTNLLRNAVEAMGEAGGTLTLRTRFVATPLRSFAAVEVRDTGPGIPPADLDRIFQPFYTTKAKGTGLGLAIVQRIVESHGGDVEVENAPPRGCRFAFLLPLPVL
jgi:signal transduction histidine kinase